jgi:uncharacterized membrane protein YfcA
MIESLSSFELSAAQWVFAFLSAFVIGVSKAGIKGISIVVVTTMALIFGSKASTGIILPLLIVGDAIAVVYYKRHTEWVYLKKLLPAMIAGVVIGAWIGQGMQEVLFKKVLSGVILFCVISMFWWDRKERMQVKGTWAFSSSMGLISGITTMIGNMAGPISNLYFLAIRLPKNAFIGTAAWLFLIINIFKMPFHIYSWKTITYSTLSLNLILLPAIFLGLWAGVKFVKIINENFYRKMILVLTAIGAIVILFK